MNDTIRAEIHRHRVAYAKRFNYDAHAIGEDIRRSEAESGGNFATGEAPEGAWRKRNAFLDLIHD